MGYRDETYKDERQNPLLLKEWCSTDLIAELTDYNDGYQESMPVIVSPNEVNGFSYFDTHEGETYTHDSAISVIEAIQDRVNMNEDPDRYYDYDDDYDDHDRVYPQESMFDIVASEYTRMSDELKRNPDEMLTLIAWRPDTILWADPSIFEQQPDFAIKAMQHNPLVYDMLPAEVQKEPAIVDIYRNVLYGNGFIQHPSCAESLEDRARAIVEKEYGIDKMSAVERECVDYSELQEEIKDKMYSLSAPEINFRLNPACSTAAMFTKEGYEQVFGLVISDVESHQLAKTYYGDYTGSKSLQFLAMCESQLPPDVIRDAKISAYNNNLEVIKEQAANSDVARTYLAQFCHTHDLPAEPEWQSEYDLVQRGVNPFDLRELGNIGNRIDTNSGFEMLIKMSNIPAEILEQQVDLQHFGQIFGAAIASESYWEGKSNLSDKATNWVKEYITSPQAQETILTAIHDGYDKEMTEIERLEKEGPDGYGEYDDYDEPKDYDEYEENTYEEYEESDPNLDDAYNGQDFG